MTADHKRDTSTEDNELVIDCKSGDRAAFDLLVEKYQFKIFRMMNRYVRDPNDSNDLTQEVFMRAFQSMHKFRGESNFYTWLYRIAVNTAKNHLLLKSKESVLVKTIPYLYQLGKRDVGSESNTPENMLISDETEHQFLDILYHLPAELRTVIMLRDQEGRSYEEISVIMDCPIGTVRSRISRARTVISRGMDGIA